MFSYGTICPNMSGHLLLYGPRHSISNRLASLILYPRVPYHACLASTGSQLDPQP